MLSRDMKLVRAPPIFSAAMEEGRWVWVEATKELVLEGDSAAQSRRRRTLKSLTDSSQQIGERRPDERITLEDVKRVAVDWMDTSLPKKMHEASVILFDQCCTTDTFNEFLWATLVYFDCFLAHTKASEDETVDIPGMLGESARETLVATTRALQQAEIDLSSTYIKFISGIGVEFAHHSVQGRLKFSRSRTDRELFEAVYEFIMCAAWVTFGYQHWDLIHSELGRVLRTPAFNKDVQVNQLESDAFLISRGLAINGPTIEQLSQRVYHQRPPRGELHRIRTPLLKTVLQQPSPDDTSSGNLSVTYPTKQQKEPQSMTDSATSYEQKQQIVGIIGQPISLYHPRTLRSLAEEQHKQ